MTNDRDVDASPRASGRGEGLARRDAPGVDQPCAIEALASTGTAESESPANPPPDALVTEVLRLVDEIASDAFEGLSPRQRNGLATRIIKKAQAWDMTDAKDIAIYCALYRYPGPAFFRRGAWVGGAERVRNGQTTWPQVFADPRLWEEPRKHTKKRSSIPPGSEA